MELPPCSVLIATRNRPEAVRDAVASILRGTVVPAELIVVDQSEEPSVFAEPVRVIRSPAVGLSAARNVAVASATSPVLVFTDDDVVVEPDWLESLVRALVGSGERAAVTGRVLAAPSERRGSKPVSVQVDPRPGRHAGRIGRDVLSGNNFALHRAALDEIGTFDERLGAGGRYLSAEDNDFGHRLLEAGYVIVYVPEAVVHHRALRAGRALRRVNWEYGVGQGAFYAKHARLRDPYTVRRLAATAGWRLRRMLTRPLRRRSLGGGSDLVYVAGLATGATRWFVRERLVPRLARWSRSSVS